MEIQKSDNGTLLVPVRLEGDNAIGDGMREVPLGHAEYDKWLKEYEREQELKKNW